MKDAVLYIHGILRWGVLGLGLAAFVLAVHGLRRSQPYSGRQRGLGVGLIAVLDTQILLGLMLLLFLTDWVPEFMRDPSASMWSAPVRFFVLEHGTAIAIGALLVHIGHARVKRETDDRQRQRLTAVFVGWGTLALAIGVPWPFMHVARPLWPAWPF